LSRWRHTPEEIRSKLREAQSGLASGCTEPDSEKLLNAKVFDTVLEAKVLWEQWRRHYNAVRPGSSLGYWPQAPEAILAWPPDALATPSGQEQVICDSPGVYLFHN
jgi:hypothetical protein